MGDTVGRIAKAIIDSGASTWHADAACANRPELIDATRPPRVRAGLDLCAKCPVLTPCRQWAEQETDYVGIAGGRVYTTKRGQRRSLISGLNPESSAPSHHASSNQVVG